MGYAFFDYTFYRRWFVIDGFRLQFQLCATCFKKLYARFVPDLFFPIQEDFLFNKSFYAVSDFESAFQLFSQNRKLSLLASEVAMTSFVMIDATLWNEKRKPWNRVGLSAVMPVSLLTVSVWRNVQAGSSSPVGDHCCRVILLAVSAGNGRWIFCFSLHVTRGLSSWSLSTKRGDAPGHSRMKQICSSHNQRVLYLCKQVKNRQYSFYNSWAHS